MCQNEWAETRAEEELKNCSLSLSFLSLWASLCQGSSPADGACVRARDLQRVWSTTRLHINARETAHLEGFSGGQCERWRESVLGKSTKYVCYKGRVCRFFSTCTVLGWVTDRIFLVARVYVCVTHSSLIRSMDWIIDWSSVLALIIINPRMTFGQDIFKPTQSLWCKKWMLKLEYAFAEGDIQPAL